MVYTNEAVEEICRNKTLEEINPYVKMYSIFFSTLLIITALVVTMPLWSSSFTYMGDWQKIGFASIVFIHLTREAFKICSVHLAAHKKMLQIRRYFKKNEVILEAIMEKEMTRRQDWEKILDMLLWKESVWLVSIHSFSIYKFLRSLTVSQFFLFGNT